MQVSGARALEVRLAALLKAPQPRKVTIGLGQNLFLVVSPGPAPGRRGPASWIVRLTIDGRRRDMGLGSYPVVTLAMARDRALAARREVAEDRDPIQTRRAERDLRRQAAREVLAEAERQRHTFRAAAMATIAAREGQWRNLVHTQQWRATLETYAFPVIGSKPVADVTTEDVIAVLDPIWHTKRETARRVRQRIEAVLDTAKVRGWRQGENPARWDGHLRLHFGEDSKARTVRHHPALPWPRMPAFMAALAAVPGRAPRALALAILTAARTGEVRGMRWREVDFAARVWTVPAERMKAGRLHRVPLSAAAAELLAQLRPADADPADLVFAGDRPGRAFSDMTLTAVVRRMSEAAAKHAPAGALPAWADLAGRQIVPHGFRSTFRDWAGETNAAGHDAIEAALAHTVRNKAEAAYARSDLLERRRPLMEAWAAACAAEVRVPVPPPASTEDAPCP